MNDLYLISKDNPYDRFYLAEDRSIFYSKPIISNPECENIKSGRLSFKRRFRCRFCYDLPPAFLADGCRDESRFVKFPLWQVLAKKIESGCATVSQHRAKTEQYIEIYEKLLQQGILPPKADAFNAPNVSIPHSLNR